MGKTFSPERAEMEANRIGEKFAHSSNVVKDMSRAYHVDFSNIKVHTDGAADSRVKAAGKDALAQGNDIFFGKGIFESSDPAAKGLVAHEFTHTMQQGAAIGSEAAVSESAPMGEAQGGIIDWFKNLFSGKKQQPAPAPARMINPEEDIEVPSIDGYAGVNGAEKLRFMTKESRTLYEVVRNASPEELRSNALLREMIMEDYKTNMAARLQQFEGSTYEEMFSKLLRKDFAGEQKTFSLLLQASMPKELLDQITGAFDMNASEEEKNAQIEEIMEHVGHSVLNNSGMMELLQSAMESFGDSRHFTGENTGRRSGMVMNTLMLRGINPMLMKRSSQEREQYVESKRAGRDLTPDELGDIESEATRNKIGFANKDLSVRMQKAVKEGTNNSEAGKWLRDILSWW